MFAWFSYFLLFIKSGTRGVPLRTSFHINHHFGTVFQVKKNVLLFKKIPRESSYFLLTGFRNKITSLPFLLSVMFKSEYDLDVKVPYFSALKKYLHFLKGIQTR